MGFWVDVTITLKKQFFLVTHFGKFLVDFHRFDVKVVIARYNAILSGGNSESSSSVPTILLS